MVDNVISIRGWKMSEIKRKERICPVEPLEKLALDSPWMTGRRGTGAIWRDLMGKRMFTVAEMGSETEELMKELNSTGVDIVV